MSRPVPDLWRHMSAFDPHPPDVQPNPYAPERRVCGTCGEALVRVLTANDGSDANPLVASITIGPSDSVDQERSK